MPTFFGVGASFYCDPMLAAEALWMAAEAGDEAAIVGRVIKADSTQKELAALIAGMDSERWGEVLQQTGQQINGGAVFFGTQQSSREKAEKILGVFQNDLKEASKAALGRIAVRAAHGSPAAFRALHQFADSEFASRAVATLSVEEKTALAEQFPGAMERWTEAVLQAVRKLVEGDIEGLQKIHDDYREKIRRLELLKPACPESSLDEEWIAALLSSDSQADTSMLGKLDTDLKALRKNRLSWNVAVTAILDFERSVPKILLGQNGFRVPHTKKELAEIVINWFEKNFPRRAWKNGCLELENRTGPVWKGMRHGRGFFAPAWPPSPSDPHIQRAFRFLGWELKDVRQGNLGGSVTATTATIDFGPASLTVSEETMFWKITADRQFDLAALTWIDVEKLNEEFRLVLAVQLVRAMQELAEMYNMHLRDLEVNDLEGFKRFQKAFQEESERLSSLFQTNQGRKRLKDAPADLIWDLKSATEQRLMQFRSGLVFALGFLERGNPWEEVMRRIPEPAPTTTVWIPHFGRGYEADEARKILAANLRQWLEPHAVADFWRDSTWILRLSKTPAPEVTTNAFRHAVWPPDPRHDLVLRTTLEVLGWTLRVEEREAEYDIYIHFGSSLI